MVRILGVVVGSAVAVAALILIVGVPELADKDNAHNETDEPVAAVVQLSQPVENPVPEAAPVEVPRNEVDQQTETAPDIPEMAVADLELLTENDALVPLDNLIAPDVEQRWYAFWSPFRSRIAADGFVTQLQRVTGLDYRVVNVKPGVYEVAFAYLDDNDIQANLSQISAATGLDVPES